MNLPRTCMPLEIDEILDIYPIQNSIWKLSAWPIYNSDLKRKCPEFNTKLSNFNSLYLYNSLRFQYTINGIVYMTFSITTMLNDLCINGLLMDAWNRPLNPYYDQRIVDDAVGLFDPSVTYLTSVEGNPIWFGIYNDVTV